MNDLGLGQLNDHVVRALQDHSLRNREGFKLEFRKQYPIAFRDSHISGMVDGDASYRRLSIPLRIVDRVNARLHGDRFLDPEVPLLLRNYGTTDPATLNRQRTLVHRAILLNELGATDPATWRHLFSPVLVTINNPAGLHIGLIQYDRTHNGKFRMYQLVAPPAATCRAAPIFAAGDDTPIDIRVTDSARRELDDVYAVLRRYFADDPPPERCLCLAETPGGIDVVLFNLAQLRIKPRFELMQLALLADYEVPVVNMTFAVHELFQINSPYWNAAVTALHAAEYGVYLSHAPTLATLKSLMRHSPGSGNISSAACDQIIGILLDNGWLRQRDGDGYEADTNPEILRAAIARQTLSYEDLLDDVERTFADAVFAQLQECEASQSVAGHFSLVARRGPLSEKRADAVLAKLEGAGYITRTEPSPGETYFHDARPQPIRRAKPSAAQPA